jgi:putative ABC transport system permease protein
MTWWKLSIKEWRRRPLRTLVTAAGIALAAGSVYSLLCFERGYRQGVAGELDRLGAQILVAPKGCPYDAASMALHGASWPCYLKESYIKEVRTVPGVATATPVLMAAIYTDESTPTVYLGIEPDMVALKPEWRLEGHFPRQADELLAGSEIAFHRGWHVGDQITLPGHNGQTAQISGILNPTHGADDTFLFLPLSAAQRLFHHEHQLTHILVRLNDPNQLDDTVRQLRGCDAGLGMNVIPLAHVFHTIQSIVNSTRSVLGCVALLAVLLAAAGLSNALLMAVSERTTEIGTLRAIGASARDMFGLLWLETLQVCLVGGVIGIVGAFAGLRGLESLARMQLPFAPTGAFVHWQWWLAANCLGGVVMLGSLAGLVPAWRAARVAPARAMRTEI